MPKKESLWERVKASSDTFSGIGGVKDLVVFKREGKTTFSGIKDSFRDDSGSIIRGSEFRKSGAYQEASGKEKREFRDKLREGTILSDAETVALVDETGNTRPGAIRGDQDINKNLARLTKIEGMKEKRDAFIRAQEKAEENFEREFEDRNTLAILERETDTSESMMDSTSESMMDSTRSTVRSEVDTEVQDWVNALQTAYTPLGPAQNQGN